MTFERVEVTPTIALIQAPNNGRFPYANSLLIQDGGVTALVDTGCGHDTIRALQQAFEIDLVICSHSHTDHTSGNWLFADTPIWMPAGIGFATAGYADRLVKRFIADETLHETWLRGTVTVTGFRDAVLTDAYQPGHVFTIGETRLHSMPAPGHLADHTCFWEPESGTLLTTDIDFSRFGPWYGNPESDIEAFEESIRRLWALEPRTVISSHKGIYRAGIDDLFVDFLAHFPRREARILAALQMTRSLAELVEMALIYGRFPRAALLLRYFEGEMVRQHMERLERHGRVHEVTPGVWQAL
ncbi:MBL fold metallo-hydrolase [Chloroflexota bacterium]